MLQLKFFVFSRSASGGRRKRSPTPKPTKVHVAHLTRNVTKDHVTEIFGFFGSIRQVDLPTDRTKSWIGTGSAYVDFEKWEMAEEARKKMDGGKPQNPIFKASSTMGISNSTI